VSKYIDAVELQHDEAAKYDLQTATFSFEGPDGWHFRVGVMSAGAAGFIPVIHAEKGEVIQHFTFIPTDK